jgi:metal transporter CNNM
LEVAEADHNLIPQMYASYPLSYPIALLLDKVLGHDEGTTYKRKELKSFVSLHRHLGAETLMEDEVTIISAVLELSEKSIKDIMVPIEDIYSLSTEQILDEETVAEVRLLAHKSEYTKLMPFHQILRQGYSRVPVYEKQNKSNFIGMLLIKNVSRGFAPSYNVSC